MLYTNVQCHRAYVGSCPIRLILRFNTRFLAPLPAALPASWSLVSALVFLKLETVQSLRGRRTGMDTEVSRYCVDRSAWVLLIPNARNFVPYRYLRICTLVEFCSFDYRGRNPPVLFRKPDEGLREENTDIGMHVYVGTNCAAIGASYGTVFGGISELIKNSGLPIWREMNVNGSCA